MLVGGGVPVALLAKLAKMLTDEYKLHKSAKEGIQYIRDELENMQAALEKVSEVPPDLLDKQVQIWARNVRKMSYNIEDTIDSFMVVVDAAVGESRSGSSTTCCCVSAKSSLLPRTYKARGDIAVEIERIKKEVEEVSKRRERYRVDSFAAPAPPSDPRLLALYEDEAKLVGIGRSREEIIKLLPMQDEEQYDCTAFVLVSLHPHVKNILSSILRQVSSNIVDDDPEDKDKDKRLHHQESQKHYRNIATWTEKEIIDKIRHALEKRRYVAIYLIIPKLYH
ncbi:disease resistance protein PIK6-NP-like [Triticum aestivum]|uniref:disease resistance protein PIK6-NP-like n=1 Tax=Triticum aestivum TaxID=4565 RepID=UPI001D01DD4D|nr:disease resistance protein PIK6-NP-like [Triticum aestivum]